MALGNREFFIDGGERLNGVHYIERNTERSGMTRRMPGVSYTLPSSKNERVLTEYSKRVAIMLIYRYTSSTS